MITESKCTYNKDTKILFTGVFGPYARDDEYGSRKDNPMELYHNQVTRVQGPFSLRMFHRTFGLLMIEANIEAASTILEFPTLDRFIDEIRNNEYDIVGINAIIPNTGKVEKMCREIRKHLPGAVIVIGGHIANREDLADIVDADHICRGDGIRWFRNFLGQDENTPIKHPAVISGFGTRIVGITTPGKNTAGVLIPSVGCPMGCNFCSTSALFGGKGKSEVFYKTGDELFDVISQLEKSLGVNSFFVLDENFLLYKERALRLLELMEENNKSWSFYVFSSARVIESYSIEQLVSLGISWLWMGIEGEESSYSKLNGVDTMGLVRKLQSHGIRVLGSTIIGLEDHTPENIADVIDYAVKHNTDFHQFMLYLPLPGTPLYNEHRDNNTLLSEEECPAADAHGQKRFRFIHPHLDQGNELELLLNAFTEDFMVNGPSLARIASTVLKGWKRYKNHPDKRIVKRYKADKVGLSSVYAGAIWAMIRYYRHNDYMRNLLKGILSDIYEEFGIRTRIMATAVGIYVLPRIRREEKRLRQGWTYEPSVIYEKNARALELEKKKTSSSKITIPRIKLPVYDLSRVAMSCKEQMASLQAAMTERMEEKKKQLSIVYEQYFNNYKILSQKKEFPEYSMNEMREKALAQIEQIKSNMHEISDSAKEKIAGFRDSMTEKYGNARDQIEQICDHYLHEKADSIMGQALIACEQVEKTILLKE